MESLKLYVQDYKSISNIVRLTLQFCEQIGFYKFETNLIASAVSEISTNIVKYSDKGIVSISSLDNKKGVRIKITDNGPGIADVEKAMNDGYSTDPTSLGVGLGVAKRAMDYFVIQSLPNEGTQVYMEKWLPISNAEMDYGVISMPDPNYHFNGDGYVFKEYGGDCLFVAVIDGLGEGLNAWKTTQSLKNLILENYNLELELILKKCEDDILKNNAGSGAAIGLIRITPQELSYLAVGDTYVKIYSEKKIRFVSNDGIVGAFQLPSCKTVVKKLKHNAVIVMCTDGIKDGFNEASLPLNETAQTIAESIFSHHRRSYGDATVMVIKINKLS